MRLWLSACVVLLGCQPLAREHGSSLVSDGEMAQLRALAPPQLPAPPPDLSNRFADDSQAAALGQKLFFETRFSGLLLDGDNDGSPATLGKRGDSGRVSCSGCHIAAHGYSDGRSLGGQISLAAGWGRRRAPSLLDVAQRRLLTWDGRRDAMYNQVFGPLESPVEYNSSRLYAARQLWLGYRSEYEALFGAMPDFSDTTRFPLLTPATTGCQPSTVDVQPVCNGTQHGLPGDGAEFDHMAAADQDAVTAVIVNMGKAIGAYERRLSCGPGRFDAWVNGDASALAADELAGAKLFIGKAACASCHSGPFFSDEQFHNVGLAPKPVAVSFIDSDDRGAIVGLQGALDDRLNVRGKFSDGDDGRLPSSVPSSLEGAFVTPQLRCVALRPSFMHTGQLTTLEQVVSFFNAGGHPFGYPGANELVPLGLTSEEQAQLTAFLHTLTGPGN